MCGDFGGHLPGQSIDFFGALRARVYDDKVGLARLAACTCNVLAGSSMSLQNVSQHVLQDVLQHVLQDVLPAYAGDAGRSECCMQQAVLPDGQGNLVCTWFGWLHVRTLTGCRTCMQVGVCPAPLAVEGGLARAVAVAEYGLVLADFVVVVVLIASGARNSSRALALRTSASAWSTAAEGKVGRWEARHAPWHPWSSTARSLGGRAGQDVKRVQLAGAVAWKMDRFWPSVCHNMLLMNHQTLGMICTGADVAVVH